MNINKVVEKLENGGYKVFIESTLALEKGTLYQVSVEDHIGNFESDIIMAEDSGKSMEEALEKVIAIMWKKGNKLIKLLAEIQKVRYKNEDQ